MIPFLDRRDALARLDRLVASHDGGLAAVWGRRRVGKTRLLLEWVRRHGGLYAVADLSASAVQRRLVAAAVAERLPGFADVEYPDWTSLFSRLARDAAGAGWRGPVVLDELPYLVLGSPELPSVLQRWLDHEARRARLVVAVAGSSQRMMQGLVLAASAPLFGRAKVLLDLRPLAPGFLAAALGPARAERQIERWTAWGGIPRYWELAAPERGSTLRRVERLVLDPSGPLHREPDMLLLEEAPSALEVRPVLDAIGAGAHRVSEIAGRIGRPATSLSRPLARLVGMGLVRREAPFGEPEVGGKRALYRIDDPFFRLWFRVVAPHRSALAHSTPGGRAAMLAARWPALAADAWEDLCRHAVPLLRGPPTLRRRGPWGPARRWWSGARPEWDIVAEADGGGSLLLGEVKWSAKPFEARRLDAERRALLARPPPDLGARFAGHGTCRALFVPALARGVRPPDGEPLVVTGADVLAAGEPS